MLSQKTKQLLKDVILNCIICQTGFKPKAINQKCCTKICFNKHMSIRRKASNSKRTVERNCRFCNEIYSRVRERNGFCNRSCASKYYVANGIYDNWQKTGMVLNKEKDQGDINIVCCICDKPFTRRVYRQNLHTQIACSKECRYKYISQTYSGKNSPSFGREVSKEQIDKQINTMIKRYGVTNGWYLIKNRKTISKGQLELFELLSSKLDNIEVQKEKRVNVFPKEYYADILLPNHNIIVEYNGDFWHANPIIYESDYYNPKKQLTAKEIWELDKIRLEKLQEKYKVYIVWESDFTKNKEKILKELVENIKNDIGQ